MMTCEEIIKKLAKIEPTHIGDGRECIFCGAYAYAKTPIEIGDPQVVEKHELDCVWRAAKEANLA